MQSTATPGLDNSLPTDDEELMEISEIAEEIVTKEYMADSTKVCMHVVVHAYSSSSSSSRSDVRVCIAEQVVGLKSSCLVLGLGYLDDVQYTCTFVAIALLYIFFCLFVY